MMRVWGRVYDEFGNYTWTEVTTDTNGQNDAVYLTALAQVIQLNLKESPFYGNFGIPAVASVQNQVPPNYWAMRIQQQYSAFFASLTIIPATVAQEPTYYVQAVTHSGAQLGMAIPV